MKYWTAVAVFMLAGIHASAQAIPELCTCADKEATTCKLGDDCSYVVAVTEDTSGNCEAKFDYCALCVIGNGSAERKIKWTLKSEDPNLKHYFLAVNGINIFDVGYPEDFVDGGSSDSGKTYTWSATTTASPKARAHTAKVRNGMRECKSPSSRDIVNVIPRAK